MKKTLATALAALFLLAVPMLAAADGPHRHESSNRYDTHWSKKNHREHESRYDRHDRYDKGSYKNSGKQHMKGHNRHYAKPYTPNRYQKHQHHNRTSRHCNSRPVRVTGVPNFFIKLNW